MKYILNMGMSIGATVHSPSPNALYKEGQGGIGWSNLENASDKYTFSLIFLIGYSRLGSVCIESSKQQRHQIYMYGHEIEVGRYSAQINPAGNLSRVHILQQIYMLICLQSYRGKT